MNSTKIWLTKSGGCILANNNSHISDKELSRIIEIIPLYYFKIIAKWKETYGIEDIRFYC